MYWAAATRRGPSPRSPAIRTPVSHAISTTASSRPGGPHGREATTLERVDPELDEVCSLERRLLDPAVRARAEEVRVLLHPDFAEIGASGRAWDRDSVVAALAGDPGGVTAVSDLSAALVAPGVALVTYATDGSRRSSLCVRGRDGWQVRFHQGTPT